MLTLDTSMFDARLIVSGSCDVLLLGLDARWTVDGSAATPEDIRSLDFNHPECRASNVSALMRGLSPSPWPHDPHIEAPSRDVRLGTVHRVRPPVEPGERILFREPFRVPRPFDSVTSCDLPGSDVWYQADGSLPVTDPPFGRPRAAAEMPEKLIRARRVARSVRVARLTDIREDEAARAGVAKQGKGWSDASGVGLPPLGTAREAAIKRFPENGQTHWVAIVEMAPGQGAGHV